jgi:hypothetical protein
VCFIFAEYVIEAVAKDENHELLRKIQFNYNRLGSLAGQIPIDNQILSGLTETQRKALVYLAKLPKHK